MKKALLINAHLRYEGFSEGRLNRTLVEEAKSVLSAKGWGVLETAVERGYDPAEEVEKHLAAHLVVLQTPVNWFYAPWPYKKYVDEVFGAGLYTQKLLADDGRTRTDPAKQYGTGGKMQGRKFMVSATWNAPREAFGDAAQHLLGGKGTADVFLAITVPYRFCGCDILPDFNCFDVVKAPQVEADLARYRAHLGGILERW